MIYILLSGQAPFDDPDNDDDKISAKVVAGSFDLVSDPWPSISADAKDLIRQCMTYDFKSRIYARDILDHPWFKNAPHQKID